MKKLLPKSSEQEASAGPLAASAAGPATKSATKSAIKSTSKAAKKPASNALSKAAARGSIEGAVYSPATGTSSGQSGSVGDALISEGVRRSRESMKLLAARLARPGIELKVAATVPLYRADPKDPSVLIRRLGKAETRGKLVNGAFRPMTPIAKKK